MPTYILMILSKDGGVSARRIDNVGGAILYGDLMVSSKLAITYDLFECSSKGRKYINAKRHLR